MNRLSQQALWERIKRFKFDDPLSHFPFSRKLASQNNWTTDFTEQAIEEYRKFMFLCCVLPGGASPSSVVDEVWHLHLTYTHHYWVEFCKNTLEQEVHHHPSKGGQSEKEKHQQWYEQTLKAYETHFGPAPASIWPSSNQSPDYSATSTPEFFQAIFLQRCLLVFVIAIFAYTTLMQVFNSRGMEFLAHFAVLAAFGVGSLFVMQHHKKQQIDNWLQQFLPLNASIFQSARFLYGAHRAYQTALLDLVNDGSITAMENSFSVSRQFSIRHNSSNPLEQNLLQYFEPGETFTYGQGFSVFNTHFSYHPALEKIHSETAKIDIWRWLIPSLVFCLGIARLLQGILHNKPVGYLIVCLAIFSFIVYAVNYCYRSSNQTRTILKNWLAEPVAVDQPLLYQFAQEGNNALAGITQFAFLASSFAAITLTQRKEYNNGSDGCASGNSCSSGDGGCGGGGGCGGCGGGD